MKFSQLSEGSTALNRRYENTVVSVTYSDKANQKAFLIKIPCPRYAAYFSAMEPVALKDCAKTVLERLDNYFEIDESGKYTKIKAPLLKLHRFGATVGIGLKAEEYPYLASIRSVGVTINFCSVAVKSEDDILLEEINA